MQIDLNNPQDFTLDTVRKLIASKDDSASRQIRVTKAGIAYLSDQVGNQATNDLAFRFETLGRGTGYVGAQAAQDDGWVKRIYEALRKNWPHPSAPYIDYF